MTGGSLVTQAVVTYACQLKTLEITEEAGIQGLSISHSLMPNKFLCIAQRLPNAYTGELLFMLQIMSWPGKKTPTYSLKLEMQTELSKR
jgi:hypothetical protein